MQPALEAAIGRLPAPLNGDAYQLLRRGVADDAAIDVHVAADGSFAFLHPAPLIDYVSYEPRHKSLDLGAYRKAQKVVERRLGKIGAAFSGARSVIEIGAADGAFLAALKEREPGMTCLAVEPDQSTRTLRDHLAWLTQFASLEAAAAAGIRADVACFFHVFEHVADPARFLAQVRAVIAPAGRIVIEVPSLDDPLLSLYRCAAYQEFYFQRQHPFVYSARSLARVVAANGFAVRSVVPYQRYGLENHLAWLARGKPGGDKALADLFAGIASGYAAAIEADGRTDTVLMVAEPLP